VAFMQTTRRWATAKISEAAVACAPRLSESVVDAVESVLARSGPSLPLIGKIVAENMRAVGLYSPQNHREYFRQVANQLAAWMHIYRQPEPVAGDGHEQMSAELARIVRDRIRVDASAERLKEAAAQGKGVILMTMHVANVPMSLARINLEVPTTVLARYSKDARRRRLKERWWRATAMGGVALPSRTEQRGGRLAKMAELLQQGRVVVIAVDMARKHNGGTPVRLFGREIYLPSGAAVLAVKTGAPLMMLAANPAGSANCLTFHGPFVGNVDPDTPKWERLAVAERLQWFADGFESFLRSHPPLWFFWGDKRWTRVFRGDPQYVRPLDRGEREPVPAAAGGGRGDA